MVLQANLIYFLVKVQQPLAAAQAAGYLESTGLPPSTYLQRFRTRRDSLLASGDVVGYEGRLDTAWALSLERLGANSPAAVQLLQLAAFLAPEPIPLRLFSFADHCRGSQTDRPPTPPPPLAVRWQSRRRPPYKTSPLDRSGTRSRRPINDRMRAPRPPVNWAGYAARI